MVLMVANAKLSVYVLSLTVLTTTLSFNRIVTAMLSVNVLHVATATLSVNMLTLTVATAMLSVNMLT